MLKVISCMFFIVSIILLILFVYLLYVSIGYRRSNLSKIRGYREKVTHRKNYYRGKHFYKNYCEYLYVYRVNGKEYFKDGSFSGKPDGAPNTVTIKYQKNNPKHSYIYRMGIPMEPILCVMVFILALVFWGIALVVL